MYPIHFKPGGKRTNNNCTTYLSSKNVSLQIYSITRNSKKQCTTMISLSKMIMSASLLKSRRENALENYGLTGGIVCQCSQICLHLLSVG